ncbi:Cytochrome d ubiquinol oxidase subunit 1 [Dermatophilus congolensis]|uniref:Cytochrome d ubiquinol oxidase subunit 1 n=1 Tax=Dermatophilus congolensis TaxID=1863 RepID=A0A239V6R8_9MICO|nr:cytochrome ubiquinol oxidase subunit I [Dermatophilus congolensis]SNV17193.1 Cytochrome d ubiquinol oxidase subunit 1 [Dermatophilus congolensis]
MDVLDLARWQFAITTVYHFLFVPITIGMSGIVAAFHTAWVRTHNPQWYKLTKFFGKLFLINFGLGLVTGIVQEFQFGMNWSDYSRFVGDIFGAPLAFEALLTFFLESTFIGLWIFGWGRIPEKIHALSMWLVHIGTMMSAFFILAANSFMQHPVGYRFNPETHRAELTDFLAVLLNKVQLVTFPHVIFAAYMIGGAVVMGVCIYHLHRHTVEANSNRDAGLYRRAARIGAVITLVASLGVMITGDLQGKVMTDVQPMKMAAAEALYETESHAPFSVFSTGDLSGMNATHWIQVPGLLSYLGKGDFNAQIQGIHNLQAEMEHKYSGNKITTPPNGSYSPYVPVTYWTFRLMMGLGFVGTFFSLVVLWATRNKAKPNTFANSLWVWAAVLMPLSPLFANSFGWLFTEIGRQPWAVYGLMTTGSAVSPSVTTTSVLISMIVFTLLYGALAVIEVKLFLKYTKLGAEAAGEPAAITDRNDDDQLVFAY